jgi:hypothetical protein
MWPTRTLLTSTHMMFFASVQQQLWSSVFQMSVPLCWELLHYLWEVYHKINVISEVEEKSLVFGSGDVLLAFDGVDIGGEKVQHVKYKYWLSAMEQSDLPSWTSSGSTQVTGNLWRCSRILFNQSKPNNVLCYYYTILYFIFYLTEFLATIYRII